MKKEKKMSKLSWVLDNFHRLPLETDETLVVMLITNLQEENEIVSYDILLKKSGFSEEKMNVVLTSLIGGKGLLKITKTETAVEFDLSALFSFDFETKEKELDQDMIQLFETEFRRKLSKKELAMVKTMLETTDRLMIMYALREASAYQKYSVQYVGAILKLWKERKYTIAQIEKLH